MNVCRQQRLKSLIRLSINARLQTIVRYKSDIPDKSQFEGVDHRTKYLVDLETDFDNAGWEKRHRWMFDWLDINEDGKITLNEMMTKANDEVCEKLEATDEERVAHNKAVENFFKGAGMDYDKEVEWDEYIKGWRKLAKEEVTKWKNNETTLIRQWGDAVFRIIDTNKDGAISLEEWTKYTSIAFASMPGWTDSDAQATFDLCDLNKDSEIDVDELTRQHLGFWYSMSPESDKLYGQGVP